MTRHRITDHDAEALLHGRSPRGRDELSPLADAIAGFRASSSGRPPRPSAAVASRLDLGHRSEVEFVPDADPGVAAPAPARAPSARRRVVMEWFAGLGLAAKISMGAVAAVAVGATGAGAAGAVGMLPEPAQVVFDEMAGTEHGIDRAGDSAGLDGATEAEDAGVDGAGLEHAEEQAGSGLEIAVEHADENAEFGLETAEENAGSGIGTGEEASDGAAPEGAGDAADDPGSQPEDAGSQADDAGSQAGDRPGPDGAGD
ncbi:hypothetical protein [Agromyces kandeliae]|uniref:Uncharacterized protein n=1 Tax=Agromyces kandeliae TaxID=2666141 RepID=A0A6L5R2Q0_9MICO|nr:hypothetical protein [Agromyces kandeliae]MRX43708.1 hypothetical protein [Agromyces kandeliae]